MRGRPTNPHLTSPWEGEGLAGGLAFPLEGKGLAGGFGWIVQNPTAGLPDSGGIAA